MKRVVNNPETIDGLRVVQDSEEIYRALKQGETVMHWESGSSMFPILMHLEYCRIRPLQEGEEPNVGDAVFCSFHGQFFMVHRCIDKVRRGDKVWYKIGTTGNTVYGWTDEVHGIAYSTDVYQEWTDEMEEEYQKALADRSEAN